MAENLLLKNGLKAYNEDRYGDALKYFKKYVDETPVDVDFYAYYYLGLSYIRIGDYTGAVENLRKLIKLKLPASMAIQIRMVMGYIYAQREDYELARDIFKSLYKVDKKNVQVLAALGFVYFKLGDNKKAIFHLKKALKLDKDNPNVLNSLGYIYTAVPDKLTNAIDECEKALKLSPGNAVYLDSVGWAYFKAGKIKKAKHYLSQALEKMPDNDEIRQHFKDVIVKEMSKKGNID